MTSIVATPNALQSEGSSIAAKVRECLSCFDALLGDVEAKDEYCLSSRAISDAYGRFKIWSSNIGAHRTGRRSLDHRLRDASHLQEHVLRLLSSLAESLGDAREISSGERVPWDQLQFSDSDSDDSEDEDEDENEADSQTGSAASQELQYKTEMDQIIAGINEGITNLLRLSASIRNPARHDQWLSFSKSFDTTPFEQYDIGHVAAKFPNVSGDLARRLGTALSRRRCYFKYRKEHRNKMGAGLMVEETEQDGKSTIASSLPDKHKISAAGVSILRDYDDQSESGFTATSFATSVADAAATRVPPLPPDADYEKLFECPFCFDIIMVKNRTAWKKHVYLDLQPYMCLRESCSLGRRMYSTRHEWLQHEQNHHGKTWTCYLGCPDAFHDRQSMRDHYLNHHSAQTQNQIDEVLVASEAQRLQAGPYSCALCLTTVSTTKAYGKHVGRHLRDLSLFILPVYATDDVLPDDDSENESRKENLIASDSSDSETEGDQQPGEHLHPDISANPPSDKYFGVTSDDDQISEDEELVYDEYGNHYLKSTGQRILSDGSVEYDVQEAHQSMDEYNGLQEADPQKAEDEPERISADSIASVHDDGGGYPTRREFAYVSFSPRANPYSGPASTGKDSYASTSAPQPVPIFYDPKTKQLSDDEESDDDDSDTDYGAGPPGISLDPREAPEPKSKDEENELSELDDSELRKTGQGMNQNQMQQFSVMRQAQQRAALMAAQQQQSQGSAIERQPEPIKEPPKQEDVNRRSSRVIWGENQFHDYEVPTPESYRESFVSDRDSISIERDLSRRPHQTDAVINPPGGSPKSGENTTATGPSAAMDINPFPTKLHLDMPLIQEKEDSIRDHRLDSAAKLPLKPQPTYVKVHREHLATDTLDYYDLRWEWDKDDSDYILILHELDALETEVLFGHTRRLRRRQRRKEAEERLEQGMREELIENRLELKYLKDRQEHEDEEARIKADEERLKRRWESKQRRERDRLEQKRVEERRNILVKLLKRKKQMEEVREERQRAMDAFNKEQAENERKAKVERDHIVTEYEAKKASDAANAKKQREELVMQLKIEEQQREQKEKYKAAKLSLDGAIHVREEDEAKAAKEVEESKAVLEKYLAEARDSTERT